MNWKDLLRKPGSSEADFTRQFCAVVMDTFPTARVSVVSPLAVDVTPADGRVVRVDLSHNWYECKRDTAQWGDAFGRLLRTISDLERSQGIQTDAIVPLIRDQAFMDRAMQSARGGAESFKAEHLTADLWIVYAEDTSSSWKYIPARHPLSLPKLRRRSVENLRSILPGVKRNGGGPCHMLTAEEHLTASLLLLDEIWESESGQVKGELIAAVPTRYAVLFTGSDSREGLSTLKLAARDVRAHGIDVLSHALLVWRNGRWEEYQNLRA